MKRKRVAIISATGTARKRTIPAIRAGGLCDIVGIHGRDATKIATLAKEHDIPEYSTSVGELLERVRPDFVFIGSPPHLHREHIQLCLEHRVPALCEKPLALTSAEAALIETAAVNAGVVIRIAHHLRHQPAVRVLRSLIEEKSAATLHRASMQWAFWLNDAAPNASWKLNPSTGGPNAFFDAGIHAVDLMLHLLPPPTLVTALAARTRFADIDDTVAALIQCGSTLVEISSSHAIRYPRNDLVLDFEDCTIAAPRLFGESALTSLSITTGDGVSEQTFPPVNPYGEEVKDFIALLDGEPSFATTPHEAYRGVQVLEAIHQSYLNGTAVDVE